MSNKCIRHSDKEGKFYCGKYNKYLCDDCLKCQDPTIYCKHRKMCLIWEFVKYGTPDEQEKKYSKKREDSSSDLKD